MSYLPTGDTESSDWNSTKYPGVCKPANFDTLKIAKNLQQQLNRCAQGKGIAKVAVDGDVGPGTIRLVAALATAASEDATSRFLLAAGAFRLVAGNLTSCTQIAAKADLIGGAAKAYADALAVPTTVSQPKPPKPASIVTSSGEEVTAPPDLLQSGASSFSLSGASGKGALILGAGAVIYLLATSKKKARKR